MVEIKFETGNEAFKEYGYQEVAIILDTISRKIQDKRNNEVTNNKIIDNSGNVIGTYSITI